MKKIFLFLALVAALGSMAQGKLTVHVQDLATGSALANATVTINGIATAADANGNTSRRVTVKTVDLKVTYTGYQSMQLSFTILKDTTINVSLEAVAEEAGEVVVVASSRTNSRIEDLPTKVEVLGAEEVNEENQIKPGNIASLLGDIAGVQIQQTNAATANADMRIQGLPGKYTQILRDGMPLFGGFSGSFGILQIPPLDLQQIELVKGAASTLYGGGAIAGMLNLVSKKPKTNSPEHIITVNRSTLRENNLNLFFANRGRQSGYTLFAGGTLQDAVDVNKDNFSDVPNVQSVFVHPRLFLYGKNNSSLAFGYTFNYENREGGDMSVLGGKTDGLHQFVIRNKTIRNNIDAAWEKPLSNDAMLTANGTVGLSNRAINTNVFGMKATQALWYSELTYARRQKQHHYVFGLNFNGDDFKKGIADSSRIPNESTATAGAFAQDDWKISNQFTLQGGLRFDYNNHWKGFLLPRVSLMYRPNTHLTMRVGGGLGYKTPTLFSGELDEREYKYLAGYNSNITAEQSWGANYDINYKLKAGDWRLTFNQVFFITEINHPFNVEYSAGGGYFRYFNETHPLQSAGAETYVQALHQELEVYLGYVYTDSKRKYDPVHPEFPLVARHKFAGIVAYEFTDHLRAGIESSFNGRQYLDNGRTTPSYLFLAAMVRYTLHRFSFVLNGENLLDYRQSRHESIVAPPLSNPVFAEVWAPLDGRVINLSVLYKW